MGKRAVPKPKHLPAKLRAIRQNFGLSQYRLARLLQVGRTRLSEFEWGRRMPSLIVLLYYARLAGVPLEFTVDDEIDLDHFKKYLTVDDSKRGEIVSRVTLYWPHDDSEILENLADDGTDPA